jgi:hypothetical protein
MSSLEGVVLGATYGMTLIIAVVFLDTPCPRAEATKRVSFARRKECAIVVRWSFARRGRARVSPGYHVLSPLRNPKGPPQCLVYILIFTVLYARHT